MLSNFHFSMDIESLFIKKAKKNEMKLYHLVTESNDEKRIKIFGSFV